MTQAVILNLIMTYRYLALFPLAFIEGPLVSVLVGFFIYMGYLSFLPAYLVLILGDLVPDTLYYFIGRFGNKKNVMAKYGARYKLISQNFQLVEKLWRDHGRKTMFFSKLAYGLSTPFLISAGLTNMPFKKFVSYALPVTLLQYAVLMAAGYYLGHSYNLAIQYFKDAGLLIAVFLVIVVVAYILFSRYARREILGLEEKEKGKTE